MSENGMSISKLSPTGTGAGSLDVTLDGITPLPDGIIACIKTYLARDIGPGPAYGNLPAGITLERLTGPDAARYRRIFATLGTRWLWWSRLQLAAGELSGILANPAVEAHAVLRDGGEIGLLELDFRAPAAADLAFLGLFDTATGQGLGKALMQTALARVSAKGARRLTVNTCTFDHPAALGFYRKAGFAVISQAIEAVPDPRLSGLLPPHAAPHVPLATAPRTNP